VNGKGRLAALCVALALGACAHQPPVELSTTFTPPSRHWLSKTDLAPGPTACAVRIGSVTDTRETPHSMGTIAYRMIRIEDATAWVRSGLEALGQDSRLAISSSGDGLAVVVDAAILKAYMFSQVTDKSANVVLRVSLSGRGGPPVEQIYRGADQDVDWISGSDESQGAFDRALADLLIQLDTDIVARCGSP
jgi:hypothetical protein